MCFLRDPELPATCVFSRLACFVTGGRFALARLKLAPSSPLVCIGLFHGWFCIDFYRTIGVLWFRSTTCFSIFHCFVINRGAQEPYADAGVDDVQARDCPRHQLGLPAFHHHLGHGATGRRHAHEGRHKALPVFAVFTKEAKLNFHVSNEVGHISNLYRCQDYPGHKTAEKADAGVFVSFSYRPTRFAFNFPSPQWLGMGA